MGLVAAGAPEISVIIPVCNLEDWIRRCLDSVVNQTMGSSSYEIIIANDGSTDGSLQVIQEYEKTYDNVILLDSKQKQGPGRARNFALDKARGKYVFFLDGDDYISPSALETVYKKAISTTADVVAYNFSLVPWDDGHGSTLGQRKDFPKLTTDTTRFLRNFLSGEIDGSVIFSLVRREIIETNNIRFAPGLHEDIPFIFQVYYFSETMARIDEILYFKVLRSGSIVHTLSQARIDGLLDAWRENMNFLQRKLGVAADQYYSNYMRGLVGCVGGLLQRTLTLHSENVAERQNIYTHLHRHIENEAYFSDYNFPYDTLKDKYCSNFVTIFGASPDVAAATRLFELKVKAIEV